MSEVKFCRWIQLQPGAWTAIFEMATSYGSLEMSANEVLARGLKVDPLTPALEDWKTRKREEIRSPKVCGLNGCERPIRSQEDRRWHTNIFHRRVLGERV